MASRDQTKNRPNPALVGLAAWAVPGLGHWLLGERTRAVILLVTIMATYWVGVLIGGVRYTADPHVVTLWFVAELGVGPQVLALYLATATQPVPAVPWPDFDIAIIYAGIAGLLNMLAILDAIGRAASPEPVTTAAQPAESAPDRRQT